VARIVLGSYMVRYPLGGMMSWVLQYIVGFQRLGHDIYFVEKSGYPNSCFDPLKKVMSDDCSYGTGVVDELLGRFGLDDRWCYVDAAGAYHGMPREQVEAVFDEADLFVDMGTHGAWLAEAANAGARVLIDGEPGFTQMKMELRLAAGQPLPEYDFYYSNGRNIGTSKSSAPTGDKTWGTLFHPVVVDAFPFPSEPPANAAYTSVMNWQSYHPLRYEGRVYGHKAVEFEKFMGLPSQVGERVEVAVAGSAPHAQLEREGWRVRSAHEVTISFDSFVDYIVASRGEFSVCKNGFVVTNNGWFSDRSGAYLASGRPVVLQETGFSDHLPCGEGVFAVRTAEEAAGAISEIESDYEHHSRRARDIAGDYLDYRPVLGAFLREVGVRVPASVASASVDDG
jgi:hypothetical protein